MSKREKIGEEKWMELRKMLFLSYIHEPFSIGALLIASELEDSDRTEMHEYIIGMIKSLLKLYDEVPEAEQGEMLKMFNIKETDIQHFRKEVEKCEYETGNFSLVKEDFVTELGCMQVVENVKEKLSCEVEQACEVCDIRLTTYNFSKGMAMMAEKIGLNLSDEDVDELNDTVFAAVDMVLEKYEQKQAK